MCRTEQLATPNRMHAFAVPSWPNPMGCFRQLLKALVAPKPHLHTPASRRVHPNKVFLAPCLSVPSGVVSSFWQSSSTRQRERGIRGGNHHSTKGAQQRLSMGTLDPCRQPRETKSPVPWKHADIVAKDGRKRQAMEGQREIGLPMGEWACTKQGTETYVVAPRKSRSNGKREEAEGERGKAQARSGCRIYVQRPAFSPRMSIVFKPFRWRRNRIAKRKSCTQNKVRTNASALVISRKAKR
ncbi:hypothetical protein J3F83DRAFT_736275 [Trichoderma novae-zelandiae]